jgi:WD40 repeat protein
VLLGAHTSSAQEPKLAAPGEPVLSADLPRGAIKRLTSARLRHGSRILCLAYAPHGRLLAAGGGDDPVRLWNTDTGLPVAALHETWVHALAFSPGGAVLITGGVTRDIRLWDAATGDSLARLKGHAAAVKSLAVAATADGVLLASGDEQGRVIVWELGIARELFRQASHMGAVSALAFSPSGKVLASAGDDRTIRLTDVANRTSIATIDGRCSVSALVFLDDNTLASGGDDNQIHLWDAASGKLRKTLTGHEDMIVSLLVGQAFQPDMEKPRKKLISAARDRTIRFWDPVTGQELQRIERNPGDSDALALSPDGRQVAAAGFNNVIRRWDAATGKEIGIEPGHHGPVVALHLTADGRSLLAGTSVGGLGLWDLASGRALRHWSACGVASPRCGDLLLAGTADGKMATTATGADTVQVWDPQTAANLQRLPVPAGDEVLALAFAPDSKTLAVGYRRQALRLWDARTARSISELQGAGPVQAMVFSPNGRTLATARAGTIALWDVAGKKIMRRLDTDVGDAASVACLAFAPDSATLAAGCFDGVIRLWDARTGEPLRELADHTAAVYALAFSRDGRHLASGSFDRTVRLWELVSGQVITTWKGHAGSVSAVALTPDGRRVVSGGSDTTLVLWDVTGRSNDGKLPSSTLSAAELKRAWIELASTEAARGYRAAWDLIAAGPESVPFLRKQVALADPEQIRRLLVELDDNKFLVRERAYAELLKHGRWIEDLLREARQHSGSEELQGRMDRLLARLDGTATPSLEQERLRVYRLEFVLEQLGGPEARTLLGELARGAAEKRLREAAQATLDRLQAPGD